jgi:photosystem II stability/assembly factor-like uncharacterized protein
MKAFYFKLFFIFLLFNIINFSQWRDFSSNYTENLNSISVTSNLQFFEAGGNKIFSWYLNAPQAGLYKEFDPNSIFKSIYFSNSNNGYAVGYSSSLNTGIIVLTSDGGSTWTNESSILGNSLIEDVYFTNTQVGWVAGYNCSDDKARIGKSTDGGNNWIISSTPLIQSGSLKAIYFIDNYTGWCVGTGDATGFGKILKSTDGGENWFEQPVSITGSLNDVYFANSLSGWVCTEEGQIFYTTDGGINWVNQYSNNKSLNSIIFIDDYSGCCVGNEGIILNTIDGGLNWQTEGSNTTNNLNSVFTSKNIPAATCGDLGEFRVREIFSINNSFTPMDGTSAVGDYDNDGDLDIALTGCIVNKKKQLKYLDPRYTEIYRNNGNGGFTKITDQLKDVNYGSLDWGDYDNDGDLDLLLSGIYENDTSGTLIAKIYRNDGNDIFIETSTILNGFGFGFIKWGDLDNDGDLDIVSTEGVYCNNGDETFSEKITFITGLGFVAGMLGDMDNDGDLDLISGSGDSAPKFFMNDGEFRFTEISLPPPNKQNYFDVSKLSEESVEVYNSFFTIYGSSSYNGTCDLGDYDNDGDLDILWMNSNSQSYSTTIYRNDGNNSFTEPALIDLPGLMLGSGAFGDFDNDGDLDVFLTGGNMYNDEESGVYRNDGNDIFVHIPFYYGEFETISWSSTNCGDFDNDGNLDLLIVGEKYHSAGMSVIYSNNTLFQNSLPVIPSNLQSETNFQDVTLHWDKSTDNETPQSGLNYNFYLGSTPSGFEIVTPMSVLANGKRGLVNLGNANHNNVWTIKDLSPGRYYWSVQAIDNNFSGSPFAAEQSFMIGPHFNPIWTGNPYAPMNIYITSATIDGVDLGSNDEIAVFDGDKCVGLVVLTNTIPSGEYVSIIASTDDPTTPEVDGFIPGHTITYKLWDVSDTREITRVNPSYSLGDGTFSSQGSALASLSGIYTITQNVPQSTGWNIFSLMATPDNPNMLQLLNSLINQSLLVKVQDERGYAVEYLPVIGWINNIGDWQTTEGYYMKVNGPSTLSVEGPPIALPLNIPLTNGWNIIGYPVATEQNALTLLNPLISANQLIKVQNEAGNAIEYLPVIGWINNIGNFKSGEGYYIKVNANTVLTFNEPTDAPNPNLVTPINERGTFDKVIDSPVANHFVPVYSSPYLPMNIYVTAINLPGGISLKDGDEVGIFDGNYCVGSIVLADPNNPLSALIASTDDPGAVGVDGFTQGHTISYKFWLSATSTEVTDYNTVYSIGDGTFISQGTTVVSFDNIIPVELTSFTSVINNDEVNLNWKTATETNNFGFDIERRSNETEWIKLGFVKGSGNSTTPNAYTFSDKNTVGRSKFYYRLKQLDMNGTYKFSNVIEVEIVPTKYALYQNYPNPFNSNTIIRYQLPKQSKVVIKIYNILGSEVIELLNGKKEAGIYEVEFNADKLSSGTYIYKIIADNFIESKKMLLLK